MSHNDKGGGGVLLALVVGGLAGAAAAFLFAPKAGKEFRKNIREKSDEFLGDVKSQLAQDTAAGLPANRAVAVVKAAGRLTAKSRLGKIGGTDGAFVNAFADTVADLITHKNFKECSPQSTKFLGHVPVFYGFMGAAATTALAFIVEKVFRVKPPFRFGSPIKILGNASGLAMLAGSVVLIKARLEKEKEGKGGGTYDDWVLVLSVAGAAASGLLAETARMTKVPTIAYGSYYVHLVIIFFVLWYAPYSKLAHMFYRTLGLTYLNMKDAENEALLPPPLKELAASTEVSTN